MEGKEQEFCVAVCGFSGSGKSVTAHRLKFDLGGLSEREMQSLHQKVEEVGKRDAFLCYLDKLRKLSQGRAAAILSNNFFTKTKRYSFVDSPDNGTDPLSALWRFNGKQVHVGLLLVPADDVFVSSIAEGRGELQGKTFEHALLLRMLEAKQLIVGVSKMDAAN
jgi:translation elongation factor EF-1alpha